MKVAIFDTNRNKSSDGPRLLSAILRDKGFETKLFFVSASFNFLLDGTQSQALFNNTQVDLILKGVEDCDVVLISAMSPFSITGYEIADIIKKNTDKPVVFGGIHATVMPEKTLEHADIVGIGECEEAIVELLEKMRDGKDLTDTRNFCFKKDGKIIKNPVRPLVHDLGTLPYPDFSFKDHYYLNETEMVTDMNEVIKEHQFGYWYLHQGTHGYAILTSRGCPHECNYCYVSLFLRTYDTRKIRMMSVERIIEELKYVKKTLPFVGMIDFIDDDFLVRKVDDIRRFAELYKKEIGMDFLCCTSPDVLTEEKLNILMDAGLKLVQVGVQSGSVRINKEIYKRRVNRDKQARAFNILAKAARERGLSVRYDFIVNNPYELVSDVKQSLALALRIPKPYIANVFSLMFYPGTPLYDRALKDKIIDDDPLRYNQSFTRLIPRGRAAFSTLILVGFLRGKVPSIVAKVLASHPFDWIGNFFVRAVGPRRFLRLIKKLV